MSKYQIPQELMKKALPGTSDRARINHDHCPAGTDTRQRLYVERKDYGIVAHCFNCGGSGFISSGPHEDNKFRKRFEKYTKYNERDASYLHPNISYDPGEWSSNARSWLFQYGITSYDISTYKIGYSSFHGGVILPLCRNWDDTDFPQSVYGYVLRYTDGTHGQGSKYSFKMLKNANREIDIWESKFPIYNHLDLVLCEDIISGIKCARVDYIFSMALLRTTIDLKSLNHIFNLYKANKINRVLIHLDNDKSIVRKHSRDIYHRLNIYIPERRIEIISGKRDPKYYTINELKELYD